MKAINSKNLHCRREPFTFPRGWRISCCLGSTYLSNDNSFKEYSLCESLPPTGSPLETQQEVLSRLNSSNIFLIFMRDEIFPRVRIIGRVRLYHLPIPQIPILNHAAPGHRISIERVSPAQDSEVGQADFVRISIDQGGHAEEAGIDGMLGDVQFKVSSIVQFGPLKLTIVSDQQGTCEIGFFKCNVLSIGAWARNGSASEFHANATLSSACVVFRLAEPNQIGDPVRMRVARDDDVISYGIVVKRLEGAITIG